MVAVPARKGAIDVYLNALGTVTPRNMVVVKPRVDGQLMRVAFREGDVVKAGELLAEIDPRPFQAALDQAKAKKAQDDAQAQAASMAPEMSQAALNAAKAEQLRAAV